MVGCMRAQFSGSAVDPKDPDLDTEYIMNWANALPHGVTVTDSSWELSTGLTQESAAIMAGSQRTRIVVSGGVSGRNYLAKNRITRSDGMQDSATGMIRVRR